MQKLILEVFAKTILHICEGFVDKSPNFKIETTCRFLKCESDSIY